MQTLNLPDHTKVELQNHIKKNIRRYYKGLKNGSLKYDFFVETILTKKPKPSWLQDYPKLEKDQKFKNHLIEYINREITRYIELEEENKYKHAYKTAVLCKDREIEKVIPLYIKEKHELKKILSQNGYTLCIPIKFLSHTESNYLKEYILYGQPIPLEWSKILNYKKKV
ncbi:hypothetical protein [Inediibacterium massiliense]|uniref:hypothetical protein n=1 Tax=Inediibacterium massiliense TaxID=1658111 RepID=UPI0006B6757A|nr:hypothetical protein [Inediibacterium massiliense]